METKPPGYSDCVAGVARNPPEWVVLHCLEQSVTLLDHMLARGRQADGNEWRAFAKNLSIVSAVLRFLGDNLIPSLLADRHGAVPQRQQAAWKMLRRLCRQTAELQLHLRAAKPTLN